MKGREFDFHNGTLFNVDGADGELACFSSASACDPGMRLPLLPGCREHEVDVVNPPAGWLAAHPSSMQPVCLQQTGRQA